MCAVSPGPGSRPPVPVSGSFLVRALRTSPVSGVRAAPRSAAAAPAIRRSECFILDSQQISTPPSQIGALTCSGTARRNSSSWIWTWSGTACVFYCLCLQTMKKEKRSFIEGTKCKMAPGRGRNDARAHLRFRWQQK